MSGAAEQSQNFSGTEPGETVDYEALIAEARGEVERVRGEQSRTQQELQNVRGEFDRVRRAFSGDKDTSEPSPFQKKKSQFVSDLDLVLQKSLEHERKGNPLPLTTKIGADFYQNAAEVSETLEAYQTKIAELEAQMRALQSPERNLDTQAATSMEGMIQSAMATIYGEDAENSQIRDGQFDVIAKMIGREIKDLRQNDPDAWNRIRRHPESQRKLVQHFVMKAVPPKARALLEQEHLQNTPMTNDELWTAYREAKEQIQGGNEHPAIRKAYENIREEILERQFAGKKGQGAVNRMNR
jgi:uncharacterized protein YukE